MGRLYLIALLTVARIGIQSMNLGLHGALTEILSGAQEIPSDLEPILFMDAVYADLKAACPSGIDKCECMHAPGRCKQKPKLE